MGERPQLILRSSSLMCAILYRLRIVGDLQLVHPNRLA